MRLGLMGWVSAETRLMYIHPWPASLSAEYIGGYHDLVIGFFVTDHSSTLIVDQAYPGIKKTHLALMRICENATPALEDRFSTY